MKLNQTLFMERECFQAGIQCKASFDFIEHDYQLSAKHRNLLQIGNVILNVFLR